MGGDIHGGQHRGSYWGYNYADAGETHVPCLGSKHASAAAWDCGEEEIKSCHDIMIEIQDLISASLKVKNFVTKKAGLAPLIFLYPFDGGFFIAVDLHHGNLIIFYCILFPDDDDGPVDDAGRTRNILSVPVPKCIDLVTQ